MLFWILALYVIVLLIVWWFFIVARMHTLKFKNFSTHITPVTNFLMIFLIILSLSWFIFIFYLNSGGSNYEYSITDNKIEKNKNSDQNNKKSYEQEITWDEYY